jgi:hypothetical protein
MEFPGGELALDEPSLGGLTFDEALVRWGRVPKKRDLNHIFYWDHPGDPDEHDQKLIDQFLLLNIMDDEYLLKHLSDKLRYQLLRKGLLERWVDNEIRVSGFPLHSQEDRRVWISSALINELRYSLGTDPVRNYEAKRDDHARGARSYAQVRFYLASMVGTAAAAPSAGTAVAGGPEPTSCDIDEAAAAEPDPQQERGRPRSQDAIAAAAEALYTEREADPPNVLEAERLIRKKLLGATRALIRNVLNRPEFKRLRRSAGKPGKNLPR